MDTGSAELVRNRCLENTYGIVVARTQATLEENTVLRSTEDGVLVRERAVAKATKNRCDENGKAGIHVEGRGTRAELVSGRCTSNRGDGIRFARGAAGTADDNECRENDGFGIVAADSGTAPTFKRNRCTRNGRAGIGKESGATPEIDASNEQSDNGE